MKSFLQFINESVEIVPKSLSDFFDRAWTEMKFPWEEKLLETLSEIKEVIEAFSGYNPDRYTSDGLSYSFDVKIQEHPDFKRLVEKTEKTEEELHYYWHSFLEIALTDFIDNLDYKWLDDVKIEGKNGRWLTVCLMPFYGITGITKESIIDLLEDYESITREIDAATEEEIRSLRGLRYGKTFGLNENSKIDRNNDLLFAEKACKELIENLENNFLDELREILQNFEEISEKIEKEKSLLVKKFDEYLEENL